MGRRAQASPGALAVSWMLHSFCCIGKGCDLRMGGGMLQENWIGSSCEASSVPPYGLDPKGNGE